MLSDLGSHHLLASKISEIGSFWGRRLGQLVGVVSTLPHRRLELSCDLGFAARSTGTHG